MDMEKVAKVFFFFLLRTEIITIYLNIKNATLIRDRRKGGEAVTIVQVRLN